MGLQADDRLLAALPLSHSYGLTTLALSSLIRGLTLVLPSEQGPFAALAAAQQLDATVFPTVPAYVQALLKMAQPPPLPSGIRLVIAAGAVLSGATAAQFRHSYDRPVHVFYGSSECGGICFDREGGAAERGSVGTPVSGVRVGLNPIRGQRNRRRTGRRGIAGCRRGLRARADARLDAGRFETRTWPRGATANSCCCAAPIA